MKTWLLFSALIVCCTTLVADFPEKIGFLSSKVVLQNKEGYFVLSDGSLWKAIGFTKRWRTASEWWSNVPLVPENYECVPNDWYLGTQIEVYSKYNHLVVEEANASNQEALKQCSHLLNNTRTGQVLFAISLDPAAGIVQLFNEAYADGHGKGLQKGVTESSKSAGDIYNNGYNCGYSDGHAEGYKTGYHTCLKDGGLR